MNVTERLEILLRRRSGPRRLPEPDVRRLLRERAGLTQKELAEALGVSRPAVSRWESGRRTPRSSEARDRYRIALDRLSAFSVEGAR